MLSVLSLKEQIDLWNDKLNSIANNFDSPWTGMILFIVLLVIAVIAINAFSSKNK